MLTHPAASVRRRQGFTLLEMTLVLLLMSLVIGIISAIGTKLQRQLAATLAHLATREALSAPAAILPLDLRSLSPAAGDIRAGEARDSSLELRVAVASGVICDASPGTVVLAPYLLANGRRSTPSVQTGDTAWMLTDADSGESWHPAAIRAVRAVTGACARVVDTASRSVFDLDHQLALDLRDSIASGSAVLVRVTRPMRYSLYRAGDGLWYLGIRTWSSATAQFNGIQPVAGPYAAPAAGATRIEYFDSVGSSISSGVPDPRGIARIEMSFAAVPPPGDTRGPDSIRVVVALRNRK
jgi:prepilin-type N-terminal cleavage/methylation domain-containing protein